MNTQLKSNFITHFLRRKLTATIITVTTFVSLMILAVCIFWYTMTHALGNYLSQQTEVLGSSLATQAAFNATQSILTNDLLSLNVLLNRLVVDENILSARVYNKKDELLAEADSGNSSIKSEQDFRPSDKQRVYSSSIKFRDEIVGHVLITLDKTPAQATLQHLNNLLIGVAIFICTIALLFVALITKWLFSPINETTDALKSLVKGQKLEELSTPFFKEARELREATTQIPPLKPAKKTNVTADKPIVSNAPAKVQFEINFDEIFEESRQRSCVLYFDILNLEKWYEKMAPLQVSNLLTPIYRAIFQASDAYLGQVHQYKNDSVLVFFSAADCEDNLYINAVSTAQLFLGVVDKLLENELYKDIPKLDFHLGLHQGNSNVTQMVYNNTFEPEQIEKLLSDIEFISQSESINALVISEDIFTLSQIQNRVFTGLPEIIESEGREAMAYEVKGMSDKYKQKIQQHIKEISQPSNHEEA
ncbi:AhpA/YtjB family protein [Marinomonas transparens]|uniref:Uncharacterized protein n=1 Tax=Marinomonas transparens TaxID=2795388 RepID=A0A934JYN6_9GAMM|nr:AhpA/YtjB family protein [Marinomonas transparens]MBJ7539645.1 hypothetical protein [Marinomonas transparens]